MAGIFLLTSSPIFATTGEYEFWLYPNGSYDSTDIETKDDNEGRAYVTGNCFQNVEIWYKVKKASGGDATRAVGKMANSSTFIIPYTYSDKKGAQLFLNVQNNNTSDNIIAFGKWTP